MAAIAVVLVALAGAARSAEPVRFGPFAPNVTVADAVAGHPEYGWKVVRGQKAKLVGATAEQPLSFAGLSWKLTLGNHGGSLTYAYGYDFDLNADGDPADERSCFREFSGVVEALERLYGPFGKHPALAHDGNDLYGGLGSFVMRKVGAASSTRDYGDHHLVTFLEVDEARGEAVMAEASYFPELRECGFRVNAFQDNDRIARARKARAQAAAAGFR